YTIGKTIRQEDYSVIKEAQHIETKKTYAVEVVSKKFLQNRTHIIRNEISALKKISQGHRNILSLHDYFETENNLYLVTDLTLDGGLLERIYEDGGYFEHDAVNIAKNITEAIAYLHDYGVIHRENILFRTIDNNSELVITGFGLSQIIDPEKFDVLTTICVNPAYVAPEVLKELDHGKPVDMWAIGVITYFLLSGNIPFGDGELMAIIQADYSFEPQECWERISERAKDFISKLLNVDPDSRLTAHQALNHSWFCEPLPSQIDDPPRRFNAHRIFKKAVNTIRIVNDLSHANSSNIVNLLEESRKDADENVVDILFIE
ncbi:13601_t:CDS:2, partial [Dentiscutata heterogama]